MMLASMAERKQHRGNHAAKLMLFLHISMQKKQNVTFQDS
jgi:hypothetical protein